MELDTPIEGEGDWENGPTIDDVISSVMKTQSKFGKKKLSLPNISRPPRKFSVVPEVEAVEENYTSDNNLASSQSKTESKEPSKARTEEIKSLMQPYNGVFGAANMEIHSDLMNTSCSSGYETGNTNLSSFRRKHEKENTSPQLSFILAENKEKIQSSTKSDLSNDSVAQENETLRETSRPCTSSGAISISTMSTTINSEAMKRNVQNTSEKSSSNGSSELNTKEQPLMTSSNNMRPLSTQKTIATAALSDSIDATKTKTTKHLEGMDHISVNNQNYMKLSLLGKGGSSKVYEVLDLETRMIKAIKVVDIEGIDENTLNGYKNEIGILERLTWSDRVVRLYDFEQTPKTLKIIMERGNKDLSSILSNARGKKVALSPFTVQHYWHGMLLACQAIHKEGIVHSDLKPANFLLVNEMVKLIDFGIASSIQEDMTSVIKDSQSGTFNYMSPESLNDVHHGPIINGRAGDKPIIKIGVKSDVWSLGCILYNLVYGRTPFQHITNPIQKLAAISDHRTEISFPDIPDKKLLDVVKKCLQFDSRKRPSIEELLSHPYLSSGPLNQKESPPKASALSSTQREAMQKLATLSPNSLMKITSMMQAMKDNHKTDG